MSLGSWAVQGGEFEDKQSKGKSPQIHNSAGENHLETRYRVHKAQDYFLENKPGDRILVSALMASDQYLEVRRHERLSETMKEVSRNLASKGDNKELGLLAVESVPDMLLQYRDEQFQSEVSVMPNLRTSFRAFERLEVVNRLQLLHCTFLFIIREEFLSDQRLNTNEAVEVELKSFGSRIN